MKKNNQLIPEDYASFLGKSKLQPLAAITEWRVPRR